MIILKIHKNIFFLKAGKWSQIFKLEPKTLWWNREMIHILLCIKTPPTAVKEQTKAIFIIRENYDSNCDPY